MRRRQNDDDLPFTVWAKDDAPITYPKPTLVIGPFELLDIAVSGNVREAIDGFGQPVV